MDIKQGLGTFVFRKQESVSIKSSTFEQLFHFGGASNAAQTFDCSHLNLFSLLCLFLSHCRCCCVVQGNAAVFVKKHKYVSQVSAHPVLTDAPCGQEDSSRKSLSGRAKDST